MSYTIMGSVMGPSNLKTSAQEGEAYIDATTGNVYVMLQGQWLALSDLKGPVGERGPEPFQYCFGHEGITVRMTSWEKDLYSLFENPDNISKDELLIMKTIYPEDYEIFKEQWCKDYSLQRALNELETWRV